MKTILICTVGGSHVPIVTAIKELGPDYVCFVCSTTDPGTSRPGSSTQIKAAGNCIKAQPGDDKPSLPNIPKQAGLRDEQFEILEIPADDLDPGYQALTAKIEQHREPHPAARLVADYTGGTKTMTSALVTAALEYPEVELQLMTGNRDNLVAVRTEPWVTPTSVAATRLDRAMRRSLSGWERYAYDEVAAGLKALPPPSDGPLRSRLNRAYDLSTAFAAWDRFDHAGALKMLEGYSALPGIGSRIATLKHLCREEPKKEPARLFDLWHNAGRRAAQGRYDDAVARVYRLLEWTAQWLLRTHCGIDSADVQKDKIPEHINLACNRDGKYQAGLYAGWQLLVHHRPDAPATEFFETQRSALLDRLELRNRSILAHGYRPIGEADWKNMQTWLESSFLPVWCKEAKAKPTNMGIPDQLPVQYTWNN